MYMKFKAKFFLKKCNFFSLTTDAVIETPALLWSNISLNVSLTNTYKSTCIQGKLRSLNVGDWPHCSWRPHIGSTTVADASRPDTRRLSLQKNQRLDALSPAFVFLPAEQKTPVSNLRPVTQWASTSLICKLTAAPNYMIMFGEAWGLLWTALRGRHLWGSRFA